MSLSIKDEVLLRFLKDPEQSISGQQLADEFDMSRTGIWKHLQTLQDEGYIFETIKRKGYLLTEMPDRVDPARISASLQAERFGKTIHYFEECTTTQEIAQQLAKDGAPDGTVVIAESQTEGKGRMMRPWESTKGKGIWMTVIVRPNVLPHQAPQFTLITAVAIVNAMKSLYKNFTPVIKWPNDILVNNRKCTGILTEMIAEVDRVDALLIGIGINVNQQLDDFPTELHDIATSISIEEKTNVDRGQLAAVILNYLEQYTDEYIENGFSQIKTMWEQSSATIGKKIRATTLREVIEGTAIGITEEGILEIQLDNGDIKRVYSADIEITK